MGKYIIRLEINGIEFQINTKANSEREARDNVWEIILERTSVISINKEENREIGHSFREKFTSSIRNFLLI